MATELMTQMEFARHLECGNAYVTKLRQNGRLVLVAPSKGKRVKVDVAASLKRIKDTADPNRADLVEYWKQYRNGEATKAEPKPEPTTATVSEGESFIAARARKMAADANLSELTLRQKGGDLISVQDVRKMAGNAAGLIRQGLGRLPDQIGAQLAAERNEKDIRAVLNDYIDELLQELGTTLEKSLSKVH